MKIKYELIIFKTVRQYLFNEIINTYKTDFKVFSPLRSYTYLENNN